MEFANSEALKAGGNKLRRKQRIAGESATPKKIGRLIVPATGTGWLHRAAISLGVPQHLTWATVKIEIIQSFHR